MSATMGKAGHITVTTFVGPEDPDEPDRARYVLWAGDNESITFSRAQWLRIAAIIGVPSVGSGCLECGEPIVPRKCANCMVKKMRCATCGHWPCLRTEGCR